MILNLDYDLHFWLKGNCPIVDLLLGNTQATKKRQHIDKPGSSEGLLTPLGEPYAARAENWMDGMFRGIGIYATVNFQGTA